MKAIIILTMFIIGCSSMTNEEIIAEKEKCINGGMSYDLVRNGFNWKVEIVVCSKPKEVE